MGKPSARFCTMRFINKSLGWRNDCGELAGKLETKTAWGGGGARDPATCRGTPPLCDPILPTRPKWPSRKAPTFENLKMWIVKDQCSEQQ